MLPVLPVLPVLPGSGLTNDIGRLQGQVFDFWLLAIPVSKFKAPKFKDLTPESRIGKADAGFFMPAVPYPQIN
jgi:hypothetical protein